MSRYKGRQNANAVERDFPHIVEMAIPDGGFGDRLDAMHDWHLARGIQAKHGQGRRDERGQYFIRWCFADRRWPNYSPLRFGSQTADINGCGMKFDVIVAIALLVAFFGVSALMYVTGH